MFARTVQERIHARKTILLCSPTLYTMDTEEPFLAVKWRWFHLKRVSSFFTDLSPPHMRVHERALSLSFSLALPMCRFALEMPMRGSRQASPALKQSRKPIIFERDNSGRNFSGDTMGIAGNCMLTRGLGFLKHLLSSITTACHSISTKKRCLSDDFFPKRSRSVDPIDAHLSEAIKDCIEYFHSCSAGHRDSC